MVIYPVILCGGLGTRLWPVSRKSMPKQFVSLIGEGSLFQQAITRCQGIEFAPPLIITVSDFRFIAAQQCAEQGIDPHAILLEPTPKNTAPSIIASAAYIRQHDKKGIMLIMPSDHYIPESGAFCEMILQAKKSAEQGQIISFGIQPDRPETGYGYIKCGQASQNGYKADSFHEKPEKEQAEHMLASGDYLWNAGIMLATPNDLLEASHHLMPDMTAQTLKAVAGAETDLDFLRLEAKAWEKITPQSIDYALMEHIDNLCVVPFKGRWSDCGDWQTLAREWTKDGHSENVATDEKGNISIGHVTLEETQNSLIWSDGADIEVAAIGLEHIMAIVMADAVLIADTRKAQQVKSMVARLKDKAVYQAEHHRRTYRPWGWLERVMAVQNYRVNILCVYAGASLTLQSHQHRSEHWIITSGQATIQIEDSFFTLDAHQSTYIEAEAKHRLSNKADAPLILIEVQTGTYLGKDDTMRYKTC